jgi:hypothetical protein
MLRFTVEAYGPLAVHEAWNEFMCDKDLEFDPDLATRTHDVA